MKPIRAFNEFIKEGIVKVQQPDISRANFLIKESEKAYSYLQDLIKKMSINNEGANSIIKLSYDTLMEIIRAKMLLKGFNASGFNAHESEVAYLRELNFSEVEVQFADQLRYFRNGIMYYGKILDKEYAEKVVEFLNQIYPKLIKDI